MKKFIVLVLACFAFTVKAQKIDTLSKAPDERITVNKEYDENGNLIGYDSTYIHQWSSDTSLVMPFDWDSQFLFRGGFPDMNSFMNRFFNDSLMFSPFFERNDKLLEELKDQFSDSLYIGNSPFSWDSIMNQHFPDGWYWSDPFGSFFDDFDKLHQQWGGRDDLFSSPDSIPGDRFFYFRDPGMNDEQMKEYKNLLERQRKEMEEFRKKWEKKNEKGMKKI